MKKSEFKKIIKPIVAECIKESLLEGGIISGIIAEVVKGMSVSSAATITEEQKPADPTLERIKRNTFSQQQSTKIQEHRKKLMAAVGKTAYNGVDLFEGTTPAPAQGSPSQQASPMANQAPGDPGVDISNLFGSVARNWSAHMTNVKEGK